ncbi:MAG TPA: NFACT family protein [Pyrinomonadaceae bacterium]|nr:NFACT family protein [Pyrinomonadaceae bacterium]
MNDRTIREIIEELARALRGHAFGKVFQLTRASLALDFRTGDGRYLFIAAEPNQPRLYLIARTVRELEKASIGPSAFALALRKTLSGAILTSITKDENDRIVRFSFSGHDAIGEEHAHTLVAQLTGRTSNIFLLNEHGRITDALRPSRGGGQEVGDVYEPPAAIVPSRVSAPVASKETPLERGNFKSLSEAADDYYGRLEKLRAFDARAAAFSAQLRQDVEKRRKLRKNLERDLAAHGDADEHKRAGDLLLANLSTAERRGGVVRLRDFYAEGEPFIELEVDENKSLQEEAAARFARYTKAKRAAQEIAQRLETVKQELAALEERRAALEAIIEERDEAALESFGDKARAGGGAARKKTGPRARLSKKETEAIVPGARRYRSTDGYEILVGRGARDNDHLTFKVARSQDVWLHAADYPGSHVIVRNQRRGEDVPHRTVIEAAQLAAHFSHARKDSKVSVNYTQRKFVSKPKGAAPGLVRLSSFRTLLVEPRESVERQ